MKVFTSYFYQIRFFKPYQIPISTACWDPKWFNDVKGQGHVFIDKNGVINGLRAEKLKPGKSCEGLCHGKPCEQLPCFCDFLSEYEKQLFAIDRQKFLNEIDQLLLRCKDQMKFTEDPEAIFIVHEAPTNECSERGILQKWLNCNEWTKTVN